MKKECLDCEKEATHSLYGGKNLTYNTDMWAYYCDEHWKELKFIVFKNE